MVGETMPRFRFTIRRMMIAVAVVAVLITAEKLRQVRRDRLRKAAEYAVEEASWMDDALKVETMTRKPKSLTDAASRKRVVELEEVVTNYRLSGDRSGKLKQIYEKAARYPWLPVEPDPPEPK
jgi:regulator of PEP synthase PpsR (kinase-PPPase family)